jgi:hypothetical protein
MSFIIPNTAHLSGEALPGPVAYYKLEQDLTDETGNYDASFDGTPVSTFDQTGSPPVDDYCLYVNSSTAGVVTPEFDVTQSGTIEAWVRITNTGSKMITSNFDTDDGGCRLIFNATSDVIEFWTRSGGTNLTATSLSGYLSSDGSYDHVVVTFNGATAALYINGVDRTSSSTIHSDWDTSSTWGIGVGEDGAYNINGRLSMVRYYDFVASGASISNAYSNPGAELSE